MLHGTVLPYTHRPIPEKLKRLLSYLNQAECPGHSAFQNIAREPFDIQKALRFQLTLIFGRQTDECGEASGLRAGSSGSGIYRLAIHNIFYIGVKVKIKAEGA